MQDWEDMLNWGLCHSFPGLCYWVLQDAAPLLYLCSWHGYWGCCKSIFPY